MSSFFFDIQRQHSELRACVPFWISLPFRSILCSASEALKWQLQYLIWSLNCCQLLFLYSPTWSYLVLVRHRFPSTFTQFHLDITKIAFDTNLIHFDEVSIDSTNMMWQLNFFVYWLPLMLVFILAWYYSYISFNNHLDYFEEFCAVFSEIALLESPSIFELLYHMSVAKCYKKSK